MRHKIRKFAVAAEVFPNEKRQQSCAKYFV